MKRSFGVMILAVAFLMLTGAAGARAEDKAEELVGHVLKSIKASDQEAFFEAFQALQERLQKGGPDGEAAARALLNRKADFTIPSTNLKMVDEIVGNQKPILAAELLLHIAKSRQVVAEFKKGHVVVGRLIVEDGKLDPEMIVGQMPVLAEGYFAGEVADLERPLYFRAQGYAGLEVPLEGKSGAMVNLGTITLKPFPRGQAAKLGGKVVLDAASDEAKPMVSISMMVGPPNTPHNGYSPRRRWPDAIQVPVTKSGEFTLADLTPGDYHLKIEAKGHVTANKKIRIAAGQEQDAGTITLRSSDLGFYLGKPPPNIGELAWEKDYPTALKKARAEKKPMLVMMTATWCVMCKKLEKETLSDPWVRHFLSGFVLVKAYEDEEVEKTYGAEGYPTLVFTDSNGKAAYKTVGYKPTLPFVGECVRAYEKLNLKLPTELQILVEKKLLSTHE